MGSRDHHGNKTTRTVIVSLTGIAIFNEETDVVLEVPRTMTNEMLMDVLDDNIPDLTECAEWTHSDCDDFSLDDGAYVFEDLEADDATVNATLIQNESGEWILDY